MQRLFKYISGANADEEKIPMSVPVITRVQPGDGYVLNHCALVVCIITALSR